jgi:transmembrane sensor
MKKDLQFSQHPMDDSNDIVRDKILEHASRLEVPYTLTNEEAWEQLQNKLSYNQKIELKYKKIQLSTVYYMVSSAASILLLLGIWYFVFSSPVKNVIAQKGQHSEYQLPDGSRISLNAESKISYNHRNFNKSRKINMEGEAFFSIHKGSMFTINTPKADIQILGTSFNVFARENSFKVSCVTGKILVSSGKQAFIILPGQCAFLNNGKLIKGEEKNIQTVAAWRNGEFNFENAPLKSVFEELERQFNVKFVFSNIDERVYNGGFSDKNLIDALDDVCSPMGLNYEIKKNSQIYIREKK